MEEIKLYDSLPSRNIDLSSLSLGWRAFTKVYVQKGTVLYNVKYKGYKPFEFDYAAPRDGFYVHNGLCLEHAKWFEWGHIPKEPVLCEFWDSKEEFEQLVNHDFLPPKYGIGYEYDDINSDYYGDSFNDSEPCYTYLMQDATNGYYKIGMSKNPEYRERTLQSEKPTISLHCFKRFHTRQEARELEKHLHNRYAHKHIRGEWFSLSVIDVMDIKSLLNDKMDC